MELLYIGRSGDPASRPSRGHHKYNIWRGVFQKDKILFFSFADTESEKRVKAALVFEFKPIRNDNGKDGFHHRETTIVLSGQHGWYKNRFTVQPTDGQASGSGIPFKPVILPSCHEYP